MKDVVVFESRWDQGQDPHAAATTDVSGHFSIKGVPDGRYKIYVKSESLGVPDQSFLIYQISNSSFPEIAVVGGKPDKAATITLPGPFASLILHVVDSKKNPLAFSDVTLRLADNPTIFLSTATNEKGELMLYLPAKRVKLEIQPRLSPEKPKSLLTTIFLDPIMPDKTKDLVVIAQ